MACLRCLGHREVDERHRRVDAEVGRVGHGAVHRRGLEQLFGRDAADVQAGAPDLVEFDQADVETGARAVERCRIPAGPAPDDHHIVLRAQNSPRRPTDEPTFRSTGGRSGLAFRSTGGRSGLTVYVEINTCTAKATSMARPQTNAAMIKRRVLTNFRRRGGRCEVSARADREVGVEAVYRTYLCRFTTRRSGRSRYEPRAICPARARICGRDRRALSSTRAPRSGRGSKGCPAGARDRPSRSARSISTSKRRPRRSRARC